MTFDNAATEKLVYLLNHLDSFIENEIYLVLSDSIEDPQHSAVTTCNLVTCYIDIMKGLGANNVPVDINQYLLDNCFTEEEIASFFEKRAKEAKYYIGKQF